MNTKNIRKVASVAISGLLFSGIMPLVAMAATPSITGISPSFASVCSAASCAALPLSVNGTNFDNTSVVNFNGSARPTAFVSSTQLTAFLPTTDIDAVGNFSMTVTNPGAGGGISNAATFTVGNLVPAISYISPTSVAAGSGAFTLSVYGSNFVPGAMVRYNGILRPTAFVSSAQLNAAIPASDTAITGLYVVGAINPIPGGGASNSTIFTVSGAMLTPTLPNTGFGPSASGLSMALALAIVLASIAGIALVLRKASARIK